MPKLTDTLECATAIVVACCPMAALARQPAAPPQKWAGEILQAGYEIPPARPALIGPGMNEAPATGSAASVASSYSIESAQSLKFEPEWTHDIGPRGPSIELAVLGAGRPNAPSLVHFAFNWDF